MTYYVSCWINAILTRKHSSRLRQPFLLFGVDPTPLDTLPYLHPQIPYLLPPGYPPTAIPCSASGYLPPEGTWDQRFPTPSLDTLPQKPYPTAYPTPNTLHSPGHLPPRSNWIPYPTPSSLVWLSPCYQMAVSYGSRLTPCGGSESSRSPHDSPPAAALSWSRSPRSSGGCLRSHRHDADQNIRKYSSRMRTARLPTVCVSLATSRCQ